METKYPTLYELDDYKLANRDQDVRGRPLKTHSGDRLGLIERMLVDRDHERVAALVLDDGRAFPVEDIEIRDGEAYIESAEPLPAAAVPPARERSRDTGKTVAEERVPIVEEELAIGKRSVERGRINVHTRVVEEPVHEEVRLRDETIEVERRPVDKRVDNASALLKERTVEMREVDEEAVVDKRARVAEEVVVRKDVENRTEQVHDTVRHTEVDVDRGDTRRR